MTPARGGADALGVGQRQLLGLAAGVLVDGDQRRHALALFVLAAHEVTGALGGDHDDVDVLGRHDLAEVDVEAVGEHEDLAVLELGGHVAAVETACTLVGHQHDDQVAALGGLGGAQHLEAGLLGALGVGRAGQRR